MPFITSSTTIRLTTGNINLAPGIYDIDTTIAAFDITLQDVIGTWIFHNTNRTLAINTVTLKSSGAQTFTNTLGTQVDADFVMNLSKVVTILHTEVGDTYRVSIDDGVVTPVTFTPNGAWNASTNTPNLNTSTNRVNGSTYYVYYVSTNGTVDLGIGPQLFEVGGRIEWFSSTVYNYLSPSIISVDTIQTANTSGNTTISTWGSVVLVPTLVGNITLTYPTPVTNLGKTIKVVQTGVPNAFTITHTPLIGIITFTNAGGELLAANGSITIEAVSVASMRQVSNSVVAGTSTLLTYGRVNASADLANISFVTTGSGTKIPFNATVYNNGTTFSGTDSIIPSQAGRYRISWFMLAGSGLFNGDGTFHVVQNGVSLGSIFVDMMEAAGVNQISNFIDVNLVAGQAVELRYKPVVADAVAWGQGSYFDVTQLPTTVASTGGFATSTGSIQTLTASGSVLAWNSLVLVNSASNTTITLPAAVTNEIGKIVKVKNLGVGVVTIIPNATLPDVINGQISLAPNISITYDVTDNGVIHTTADINVVMTPATSSNSGKEGLVPTPTTGQQDFKLLGDGTWDINSRKATSTLPNQTSNITISAASINNIDELFLAQTSTNITLTLASPTIVTKIRSLVLNHIGNSPVSIIANASTTRLSAGGVATYEWTGSSWTLASLSPSTPIIQRFNTSGIYTPTPGMKYCIVEAVGGGGAGSGATANPGSGQSFHGSSGQGGSYVKVLLTSAQIGVSQVVTIGAGAIGIATTPAANGAATTLGSLFSAIGGRGGLIGNPYNSTYVGGLLNVSRPDPIFANPTVTTGTLLASSPSACGEVTMIGGNASFIAYQLGDGGNSMFGAGARAPVSGNATASNNISVGGVSASANSGGGGTSALTYGSAAGGSTGGSGGSGVMVITEYFS